MKRALEILVLAQVGLIVAEASILVAIFSKALWLSAVLGIAAYLSLLIGLFFREENWVPLIFEQVYRWIFRSLSRGGLAAGLCFGLATAGGIVLYDRWPRPKLSVQVFLNSYLDSQIVGDATVHASVIGSAAHMSPQMTDAKGIVIIPVSVGDFVKVAVEADWQGRRQLGAVAPHQVKAANDYLGILLKDIPADAWLGLGEQSTETPNIVFVQDDPNDPEEFSLLGVRFLAESPASAELESLGLPEARFKVVRRGYTFAYSPRRKGPVWIAHKVKRDPNYRRPARRFVPDPVIPAAFSATDDDYRGSGYARGAPLSAREISGYGEETVKEWFLLSITTPQIQQINQGIWNRIERYSLELEESGNEVFALSGPLFLNGNLSPAISYLAIGENRVAVPTHYFRAFAIRDQRGAWRIEAYLVPNSLPVTRKIADYELSRDKLQKITGFMIFPNVTPSP